MRAVLVLGVLGLAASFGGALHPVGDSLAVFRGQIAVVVVLLAMIVWGLGARRSGALGAIIAIGCGLTVWPSLVMPAFAKPSDTSETGILVYQKNMSFRMPDTKALTDDIRAAGVTHITLQEVDPDNRAILAALKSEFPSQHLCGEKRGVGGMAVLSRWPRTKAEPICNWGFVAMQVQGPDTPVWIASVHLNWPYPHNQARQVSLLLPILKALDQPVVIGGDFNMVPYASSSRRIRRAAGVQAMPGLHDSFPRFGRFLPLAIDHVWASKVTAVEVRPLLGSDHMGLLARIEG
ncbi:endonuclease/exonuclease/phosphatase family protein [Actibacterium pelagium]|uniref:Endonuclease/exonuclease/phosphatase domain-containing protein n=2 Tax=Actibacterium pelagium TaxID=2029103 RepID=A0A917ADF8_9RHOB|nr:endonuclease/exonuclease/phosphatase family protein [Actibacterium pelagium]GGE40355.1 hypothetical protein GCM10011517_05040 [Actibacterium pelagium]